LAGNDPQVNEEWNCDKGRWAFTYATQPDRLSVPLRRVGDKGAGREAFVPISWDDALDEVAEHFTQAAQRHGAQTVWPYYYAGTMGRVQRDGINRLRHAMGYSGELLTICNFLTDAGWLAGVGVKGGEGRDSGT